MPRDYNKIDKVISETGFFSEYLPPCFMLDRQFLTRPPDDKCDLIAPVCFTMSRYSGNDARRSIFIPEIGSYVVTSQFIQREHIVKELIEFSETSDASFSPILGKDDRIVRHEQSYDKITTEFDEIPSDYIENVAKKIIRSAGATSMLKLDISNCYSSFYVHMIPAILLGMENTEIEYKKYLFDNNDDSINPTYLKYMKLDSIIRQQNLNRTNGLLTGTLYSKIVIESILTCIDKELQQQEIKHTRYVDDYEVYLYGSEEKQTISIFENTLKRYGFVLNSEKTELLEFPYYITENLEKIFHDHSEASIGTAETMELFNSFLSMEKAGIKGAIRYLLKSIEKNPIDTNNPELFKSYLLTILGNNERSLIKACTLLIYNKDTLMLNQSDIKFITELLVSHIHYQHDLEVIWLLYLLMQTDNVNRGDAVALSVADSHNELAQLLLLRNDLLSETLLSEVSLYAKSWILLYELYASDHIDESDFVYRLGINKNLDMYRYFKRKNLHFVVI